jgi:hypothetical protein
MQVHGIDFSSAPSRRKPIVCARATITVSGQARLPAWTLALNGFETLASLDDFTACMQKKGPWLAGCDFPFGLPREFLKARAWPPFSSASESERWSTHIEHLASLSRADMVTAFREFCAARPVGGKFAHRACDLLAGASPSMKWVNPPVAYMLHAGATRLHLSGVSIPGLKMADPERVALEAYPGYLARMVLGRESYKSDTRSKQTPARQAAREALVEALLGRPLPELGMSAARGFDLKMTADEASLRACILDASGDRLDAWLCAIQACVGYLAHCRDPASNYGMGLIDPIEGWIVSVARAADAASSPATPRRS